MMSMDGHLGSAPPVPKYSKELQTAVQDDKCRQEIDSAKKRAAAQNVDYESFAALVSMAHVKPFERRRGQEEESAKHARSLPAWSFDASGSLLPLGGSLSTFSESFFSSKTGDSSTKAKQEENGLVAMGKLNLGSKAKCITADSFKREWRRLGTNFQKKLAFLLAIPSDELPNIFKVELPPSILSDVIEVLHWWKDSLAQGRGNASLLLNSSSDAEVMQTSTMVDVRGREDSPLQSFDAHLAFQMLKSLCACGRFSLSLKLAGARVSSLANQLIIKLGECREKKESSSQRIDCLPCMSSSAEHDVSMTKDSKTSETVSFKGQTLRLDELEHLASVYTPDGAQGQLKD